MLSLENLVKTFKETSAGSKASVAAVDGVSLEVAEGKLYTLLGPSGCGKTTTLRMVAGLETPDAGRVTVGNRTLYASDKRINVPTHRRGFGMVFQSYAIWPNMTVRQNIAFALKGRGTRARLKRSKIAERVESALDLVNLTAQKDRPATKLSGGQQQRLALARALAVEPAVLLLDEPLSNLDQKLREKMRLGLKRIQRDSGVTTLYVTHDQLEAMALSTEVAVMNAGKIEQLGRPAEVYNSPATRFVADFIGKMNFLEGHVQRREADEYVIDTPYGPLTAPSELTFDAGEPVTVAIRPENVEVLPATGGVETSPGVWSGVLDRWEFIGDAVNHYVRLDEATVVHARAGSRHGLRGGDPVELRLPSNCCAILRQEAGA